MDKRGEGGYHEFPGKMFCLTVPKKFVGEPFDVSENLGYRKILCIIGGVTFFRRKFLVSQCQKTSWGTLLCFKDFLVWKKMDERGGYHDFRAKCFCLTVPKKFVGEPFCVSKEFWYRNFSSRGVGKLHGFVKNFFI